MDSLPLNTNAADLPSSAWALRRRQLVDLLISDAASDVEVVSRELGLREEMRERLRRALDRIACVQSVLESIGPDGAEAVIDGAAAESRMREAVDLLARGWPEDYPAGAVEWLILQSPVTLIKSKRLVPTVVGGCCDTHQSDAHHFRFDGHHFVRVSREEAWKSSRPSELPAGASGPAGGSSV